MKTKMKKKRELQIGNVPETASKWKAAIDSAMRWIRMSEGDIGEDDVRISAEAGRLVARWESDETEREKAERIRDSWITDAFDEAMENGSDEFYLDCGGSMEKVGQAASVITGFRFGRPDVIVSGTPVFDESGEKQIGITVSLKKKSI